MSVQFYYISEGKKVAGPVDRQTLFFLAQEGGISPDTLVRHDNGAANDWRKAEFVEGIFNWRVVCPHCGGHALAELSLLNTECNCPHCGKGFVVESPDFDAISANDDHIEVSDNSEPDYEDFAADDSREGESFAGFESDWAQSLADNSQEKTLVCPHCWSEFAISKIKYISRHYDLVGDSVVGQDEQQRFTPTKFTAEGHALDARGLECPDKACPQCHLIIPESFIDFSVVFYSIVGAPSSGKSYFLTSMAFGLRNLLPKYLDIHFTDASPTVNSVLNEYEEKLFFNADSDKLVGLPKTELQGESFSDHITLNGIETELPRPLIFIARLSETHSDYAVKGGSLNHNVVFYDNAGEHFQPGRDFVSNPATLHLRKSSGIIFVFDPVIDSRMRRKCRSDDPQLTGSNKVIPQQRLFGEMIERIRKYTHMTSFDKYPYPIVINVVKYDIWESMTDIDLRGKNIWIYDEESFQYILNMNTIKEVSYAAREMLLEVCPELVQAAESFCNKVFFIPTSALGTSPEQLEDDGANAGLGIRPRDINPIWAEVPAFLLLAAQGYIKTRQAVDTQKDDILNPDQYNLRDNKIMVSLPNGGGRLVLPKLYCGSVIYNKDLQQWIKIPKTEDSDVSAGLQDSFWD